MSEKPYTPLSNILPKTKKKSFLLKRQSLKTFSLFLLGSLSLFLVGVYFGYSRPFIVDRFISVLDSKHASPQTINLTEFWKVWKLLEEKYSHTNEYTNEDRLTGAIKGLVESMKDPYTVYFPKEESKLFNEEVSGSFSGIGVEIGVKDKMLVVIAPLKNSPAEKAGLKTGDIISKIGDLSVVDLTLDQTIKNIRGEKGTFVSLTILRKNVSEPIIFTIQRDIISIPTIDEKVIDDTYIISLYNFNASAADLFHKALLNASQSRKNKIILDLRGNPGGYLDGAISIASEFLPEGTLIVSENFGNGKTTEHRSYGYNTINKDVQLVVLIDKGSASASEIVAGALKDHNRATLIGETSFGKGSVQELIQVSTDTSIKITIADWLTPNGYVITKKGIEPNIVVSNENNQNTNIDKVLDRALEFIKLGK